LYELPKCAFDHPYTHTDIGYVCFTKKRPEFCYDESMPGHLRLRLKLSSPEPNQTGIGLGWILHCISNLNEILKDGMFLRYGSFSGTLLLDEKFGDYYSN